MSNLIRKEKTVNEKELLAKDSEEITHTDIPNEDRETQIKTDSQQNNETANPEKPKRAAKKKTASSKNGKDGVTESKPRRNTARKKPDSSDTAAEDNSSVTEEIPPLTDITAEKSDSSEDDIEKSEKADEQAEAIEESSGEFASIFNVSSDSDDTYDSEQTPTEDIEENDSEAIIPPDEIFAYMAKDPEIITEAQEEDISEDDVTPDEESIDEDGQYCLTELETEKEPSEKAPAREKAPEKYDRKNPRRVDGRFDLIELFVFTLLAVMILTSFFFKHSVVQGPSMENTLHNGDHLIISDFLYTPKRGDVVVCDYRTEYIPYPIVKRVIGVAGDHIKITAEGKVGKVYVNGRELDESYINIDDSHYKYEPYETDVPEGMIFVMGDHRNDSADSRDELRLGMVSVDSVLGKVLLRFYPFDKFGTIQQGIKYAD